MMDWAGGTEARNYGIRRATDSRNLSELLQIVLFLVAIAGVLSFYLWIRSQIINVGYQNQQLNAKEEALVRVQARLILEEQTLKNPERLDVIARTDLGMIPLRPNQLISPPTKDADPGSSNTLALANLSQSSEPRKPSATN
jgi:cell division protein FtsL